VFPGAWHNLTSVEPSSIHSKSSIKPLQISKEALQALKGAYRIGDELWDLTSTFGDKPMSAAVGEGAIKVQDGENGIQGRVFNTPDLIHVPVDTNNNLDISYRLTFPMPVGIHDWTLRQMAVFHHHDPNDLQNLWIFFHVGQNTPMQKEHEQYISMSPQGLHLDHAWFLLHSSVFSSCLDNWRTYVNCLGHDVDKHVGICNRQLSDSLTFILD
jgi:hypothetical protein